MCPTVVEDVPSSDEAQREDAVLHLLRAVQVAKVKKAEQDWNDSVRWWTRELFAGRMPVDLRIKAAANYRSVIDELKILNETPGLGQARKGGIK